jgi:tetratricopeptide (TPR) repeat protein
MFNRLVFQHGSLGVRGCRRFTARSIAGVALIVMARANLCYTADVAYAPLAGVLDGYGAGHYDEAITTLIQLTNYRALARGFEKEAPKWISSAPADAQRARPRVAALVALEIARLGFIGERLSVPQFEDAMRVLRFGRTVIRGDPNGFERPWLLASVALIQGMQNVFLAGASEQATLSEYWQYAQSRFPDEGRFRLAALLAQAEARRMPNRAGTSAFSMTNGVEEEWGPPNATPAAVQVRKAIEAYGQLLAYQAIAPEVHLRRGIMLFHREDLPGALADVQAALFSSVDPYIVYVGHVYKGLTLEALGQPREGMAAYEAALRIAPRAPSAALLLAEALVAAGRQAEAAGLLQLTFSSPARLDPWTEFSACDYRFFADDLRQLREMVGP